MLTFFAVSTFWSRVSLRRAIFHWPSTRRSRSCRAETEEDFYVGARQDLLRRVDDKWMIARRKLTLDQNVLTAKNVSIFF